MCSNVSRRSLATVSNECKWMNSFLRVAQNDSAAALSKHYPGARRTNLKAIETNSIETSYRGLRGKLTAVRLMACEGGTAKGLRRDSRGARRRRGCRRPSDQLPGAAPGRETGRTGRRGRAATRLGADQFVPEPMIPFGIPKAFNQP